MFNIIQKGGVLLSEIQIKELDKFYVHISKNGDCLFGTAFRGILQLYFNGEQFIKDPLEFFENIDDREGSFDLLELFDLTKSSSFLKAVRNFRRYIYNCIIKFLQKKNYNAIFELFSITRIIDLFDFVFYGNNSNIEEQTTYFQERLFKDVEMKYTPTDNKMIEDKLINLLIDHFDKMKIEDYDYTKSVGPEFWGGMAELFFISNIFDVVFYIVNEQTSEIFNDPVGNSLVSIDRSIPIYYLGAHYDSLKRDVIEKDSFNGVKTEHQNYIDNGIDSISDRTIKLIKDSCTADVGKDFPQIRPSTELPIKPIKPSEILPVKKSQVKQVDTLTFDDIVEKFNIIKDKYSEIFKLGFDIYFNPKSMSDNLDSNKNLEIVRNNKKINMSLLDFLDIIIKNEVLKPKILSNYYLPLRKLVSELTNYDLRAFTNSLDEKSKKDTLRLIILYLEFYQTFIGFNGKIPKQKQ